MTASDQLNNVSQQAQNDSHPSLLNSVWISIQILPERTYVNVICPTTPRVWMFSEKLTHVTGVTFRPELCFIIDVGCQMFTASTWHETEARKPRCRKKRNVSEYLFVFRWPPLYGYGIHVQIRSLLKLVQRNVSNAFPTSTWSTIFCSYLLCLCSKHAVSQSEWLWSCWEHIEINRETT